MKLRVLLGYAGFQFGKASGSNLLAKHPSHPAILRLDMARSPMPTHVADYALDIVEEVFALGVKEEIR